MASSLKKADYMKPINQYIFFYLLPNVKKSR